MCRFFPCGLLAALVCVAWCSAGPRSERKPELKQEIRRYAIRSYIDRFQGNKPATVIANGQGSTCLQLYVFDEHGNCVARDDVSSPQTSDDLLAVWVPAAEARYDVEVCNAGNAANRFQIALR